jgi:alcohol dehydrogenase class IV
LTSSNIVEFLFPGKLIRYAGASRDVGSLLSSLGVGEGTVVIVSDRVVHDAGLTDALLEGLTAAGFTPRIFSDIVGEPDIDMVEKASDIANDHQAQAFIGIGGGSALDTAKLVAYSASTGAPLRDLKGLVPLIEDFRPLVLIPTTVGTGAEATRVAMFSVDGAKRAVLSPQFIPALAVLDENLVHSLPAPVIASTALDALAHSIESMMSSTANELTWIFSREAAVRIFANLKLAYDGDLSARSELLFSSFLAGVALNAGVVLGHSMSYVLSARHHMAHGVGCALALPYCIAYNQLMDDAVASDLASAVLNKSDASLRDVANAVLSLTTSVSVATDLETFGTPIEELPELAEAIARDYPRPTNPVPLQPERLTTLLKYLRAGDLPGAWTAMGEPA